ncbi:MAG: hypothetical protein D6718_04045 [Acidobacteria bacterium]|nr:MAG: hypothetical protein D6718_04045 [Acidobacteriota bacterium]
MALLDLIERPAAAVTEEGKLLGGNALFGALAARCGHDAPERLAEVLPEEDARAVGNAVAGGDPPATVRLRDGREAPVRVQAIDAGEGPRYGLVVIETEETSSRRAAARACAALRHELAGPLTAILGTAEMLLVQRPDLPREVRDRLGEILDNCGRISEIITRARRAHDD